MTLEQRRITVEVETVYPTDLLVRWIARKWRARRTDLRSHEPPQKNLEPELGSSNKPE